MGISKRLSIAMVIVDAGATVAELPFYRHQILGDAFYTVAIFVGYALLGRLGPPLRQAA